MFTKYNKYTFWGETMNTLIKNIDEERWHFIKIQAAKERKTIGELFNAIILEYENKEKTDKNVWERVLSRKPSLTEKQAEDMKKTIKCFKKSYGFEG